MILLAMGSWSDRMDFRLLQVGLERTLLLLPLKLNFLSLATHVRSLLTLIPIEVFKDAFFSLALSHLVGLGPESAVRSFLRLMGIFQLSLLLFVINAFLYQVVFMTKRNVQFL
jgi:hypothetical protein